MEEGEYDLVTSESYADLPPTCEEDIVDRLRNVFQSVLTDGLQTLDAKLMGRLEAMSQKLVSKQEAAFQRFFDAVDPNIAQKQYLGCPAQHQMEAASSHFEEEGRRSKTFPDELLCVKTESQKSQKERYRNLLHHARCRSQRETASRLRLLHSDQLLGKCGKSLTECTAWSSPSILVRNIASSSSSNDNFRLQENKTNQRNTRLDSDPTITANFQRDENKEEIDNAGEITNEQDRDVVRTTNVSSGVLPGSVQDDVNFSSVLPRSSTIKKMKDLRAETEASIVAQSLKKATECEDAQGGNVSAQTRTKGATGFLFKVWAIWGIVPWSTHVGARWYRQVVVFFAGCAAVYSMFELVRGQAGLLENIANASLHTCALLSLIFLRRMGDLVGPIADQCTEYAKSHGFLDEWGMGGLLRLLVTMTIWAATTSLTCVAFAMRAADESTAILMVWRDGLLLAILHCLWQVLAFLELMVDSYCIEFFACLDCHWGVSSWNGLQALLRRVAETVENSFLAVQSAMIVAVLCCTARLVIVSVEHRSNMEVAALDGLQTVIIVYIRLLLIGLVVLALFAKAASVTDKCSKVAPLVNSVNIQEEQQIHYERQYLVSYIIHSDAGFYVRGSRFTTAMLLKCCYVFGTIIVGMGTTILSMGQKK